MVNKDLSLCYGTTNPHDWTKPSIFRSVIYLDRDPFLGVSVRVHQRSENHRFGLDARVGYAIREGATECRKEVDAGIRDHARPFMGVFQS